MARSQPAIATRRLSFQALALIAVLSTWFLLLGVSGDNLAALPAYFVTEFMVTYAGGFVRRGLLGQLVWYGSDLFHVAPLAFIFAIRVTLATCYLAVVGTLCYRRRQQLGLLGVALIASSPFITMNVASFMGAFDIAFILLPVAHTLLARGPEERYAARALFLFSTVGLFISLSHEGYLFLCLPINLVIALRKFGPKRWISALILQILPINGCLLAFISHGTYTQANKIIGAWGTRGVQFAHANAIGPLGASAKSQILYTASLLSWRHGAVFVIAAILCFLPLYFLVAHLLQSAPVQSAPGNSMGDQTMDPNNSLAFKSQLRDFILIPFLCTVPLFVVGCDWHRWVTIPMATGILCLLVTMPSQLYLRLRGPCLYSMAGWLVVSLCVFPTSLYFSDAAALRGPLTRTVMAAIKVAGSILHRGT
jgi:hypothetical protein